MRQVLRGGLIGGLPGFLIAFVPLLLHEMGVITSDQSQVGFIGVPLLFLGILFGLLWGSSSSGHSGKVMLGALVGFVAGILGGMLLDVALQAAGLGPAALIVLLAPIGMLAGGVLGVRWGEHHPTSHPNAPQY
jgi:hypothetical protein